MNPIPRPEPRARFSFLTALLVMSAAAAVAGPWLVGLGSARDPAAWRRREGARLDARAAAVAAEAAAAAEELARATARAADSLGRVGSAAPEIEAPRAFAALAAAARDAGPPVRGASWGMLLQDGRRDLAWWGSPDPPAPESPNDGAFLETVRSRTVIGVATAIGGGRRLVASARIDAGARAPRGGAVRFVPAGAAPAPGDADRPRAEAPVVAGGREIGRAVVDADTFEGARSRRRAAGAALRAAAAALAVALAAWRVAPRTPRAAAGAAPALPRARLAGPADAAPAVALVWAARVLFALARPPAGAHSLLGTGLFEPDGFAASAPLGLLRSPADLLLTVAAVAATVWLVDRADRRGASARARAAADGAPGGAASGADSGGAPSATTSRVPAPAAAAIALAAAPAIWLATVRLVERAVYAAGPRLFDAPLPPPALVPIALIVALAIAGFASLRALAFFIRALGLIDRPLLAGGLLAAILAAGAALAVAGAPAAFALPAPALFAAAATAAFALARIERPDRAGRPAEIGRSALLLFGASLALLPGVDRGLEARDRDALAAVATRFATPRDEWRRFVLEETIEFFSARPSLADRLARGVGDDADNLAYAEWAASPLASLGYECALEVLDAAGAVVSRFSIGIPTESGYRAAFAFRDARETRRPVILTGRRAIGREVLDTYLGATPILAPDGSVAGAVVVTVPYLYENLAFAARPQSRRPLLSAAATDAAFDFDGRVVVSRFERGVLTASSDPTIALGLTLPEALAAMPAGRFWEGSLYGGPEATLLVRLPGAGDAGGALEPLAPAARGAEPERALLAFTFLRSGPRALAARLAHVALVGAVILLARAFSVVMRGALRSEPRAVTFREKLLAAFLVIAVIPALLMGLLTYRLTTRRLADESRREAVAGLDAVRSLLRDRSAAEATRLSETTLIRRLALGLEPATAIDLETGLKKFSVFTPQGELLLQNGVVPDVSRALVRRVAATLSPETFFSPEDGLSVVSLVPIVFEGERDPGKGALLLRTPVDGALLSELGEEGNRDLIVYGTSGLAATNRPELFQSEMLPWRMPAGAYVDAFLHRREATYGSGVLAGAPYVVAYGALLGAAGEPLGALAVPLLFRQREIDAEVARSLARIFYATALVVVVVSFLATLVADRIARPVAELSAGTKRVSRGDLAFSLRRTGGGELGELVDSFNRMTEELRRSRNRLLERTRYIEAILGNMTTGVLALDREGRITTLNRGGARILGLAEGAGIGRPAAWLRDGLRDAVADTLDAIGDARGGVLEREIALSAGGEAAGAGAAAAGRSADARGAGAVQSVHAVGTRLLDEAGEEIGRILVFEDLTELIRSKKLLAWGEMARQVAHEIKNPLTPMKLSAQHMREAFRSRTAEFPRILDEGTDAIIHEIESLRRIATEFSAFARMPRRLVREEDLGEIVRESARFYGVAGGVDVEIDLAASGPRVRVDREELKRVLVNLIENAVQASAPGRRVRVRTFAVAGGRAAAAAGAPSPLDDPPPPGGFVSWSGQRLAARRIAIVAIEDEGSGIAPEFRARLFEPNFSTKTNGTGLGLAICKGIVEDHGGAIRIASAVGRGTSVLVALPEVGEGA